MSDIRQLRHGDMFAEPDLRPALLVLGTGYVRRSKHLSG